MSKTHHESLETFTIYSNTPSYKWTKGAGRQTFSVTISTAIHKGVRPNKTWARVVKSFDPSGAKKKKKASQPDYNKVGTFTIKLGTPNISLC